MQILTNEQIELRSPKRSFR